MVNIVEFVRSLVRPKAGDAQGAVQQNSMLLALDEYASQQRRNMYILGVLAAILTIAPLLMVLLKVEKEYLPYLLGANGLFAAGTLKFVVSAFQNSNTAYTLLVISQNLQSVDAKSVMIAWLKERTK